MKPEKIIKTVQREVVLKPARIEERKTGRKIVKIIIDPSGNKSQIEEDEIEKIHYPAEKMMVNEEVQFWCVRVNEEDHEFLTKKEADIFIKKVN